MWDKNKIGRGKRETKETRRNKFCRLHPRGISFGKKEQKVIHQAPIAQKDLVRLYTVQHKSMQEIATQLGCSLHKVKYWIEKFAIPPRSQSDATYYKRNPDGDPFRIVKPRTPDDIKLFGLGLGLYWGEGTKSDKNSIKLGNTDPELLKSFIAFLERCYDVEKTDFRCGLQIFNDISPSRAVAFWTNELGLDVSQFQKTVVTPSRGKGTYRKKSPWGVLTVQFHNKKLRDILMWELHALGLKIK